MPRRRSIAWRRSQDLAAKALDGRVMAAVGNATYFHTASVTPDWSRYLVRIGQVGGHLFYRFAGHDGAASMFNGAVEPSQAPSAAPPAETPVYASLGPGAPAQASPAKEPAPVSVASLFLTSATQAVEHAAAAAAGATETARAPAPAPAKTEPARADEGKGGGGEH